jgi:hypothetical protein
VRHALRFGQRLRIALQDLNDGFGQACRQRRQFHQQVVQHARIGIGRNRQRKIGGGDRRLKGLDLARTDQAQMRDRRDGIAHLVAGQAHRPARIGQPEA